MSALRGTAAEGAPRGEEATTAAGRPAAAAVIWIGRGDGHGGRVQGRRAVGQFALAAGTAVAGALLLFGGFAIGAAVAWTIAALRLLGALCRPESLGGRLGVLPARLASAVVAAVTRLLMAVLFFLVVVPVGLVLGRRRRAWLDREPVDGSYFRARERAQGLDPLARPF
jgi:hypothetical protein